jgi:hypothetical protein
VQGLSGEEEASLKHRGYDDEVIDELREEMVKIKILCIVTHVMEMTRNLSTDHKKLLERFCDNVMLSKNGKEKEKNEVLLIKNMEYKNRHIDLWNVKKIGNIKLKPDDEQFIMHLYDRTKLIGFREYYA